MKKGTDYSKTAIQLTNPNETRDALLDYDKARTEQARASMALQFVIAKLPEQLRIAKADIDLLATFEKVKETIDRAGSFQDIEAGLYALKYGRKSVTYDVEKVKSEMPKYVGAVVEEVVDGDALKVLLKAKKITAEQVARCEVITPGSPAYIIGVVEQGVDSDKA